LEQALAFDGATGPYVQYAVTRLGSILRKAGPHNPFRGDLSRGYDHPSEKALAMALAVFPSRVQTAAKEMRPSVLAQWCLETAQSVNDFYRDVSVLESEGALREGRIRLVEAARTTLSRGLDLLGIPLPDEM
jgi:arginyl-tRNA synthetase